MDVVQSLKFIVIQKKCGRYQLILRDGSAQLLQALSGQVQDVRSIGVVVVNDLPADPVQEQATAVVIHGVLNLRP